MKRMHRPAVGGWTGRMIIGGAVLALAPAPGWAEPLGPFTGTNGDDVAATLLLVVGVLLMVLEIKIVSFGILGILGTVCLAVGAGVIWQHGGSLWGISFYYIVPLLLLTVILTVIMAVLAAQAHKEKVTSGSEGYVGELAVAAEPLSPLGRVFFEGTYWDAESSRAVMPGEKVRITRVDRLKLYVEPADSTLAPTPDSSAMS